MYPKYRCTKATSHALIFFSILSFLLLLSAFDFNFPLSRSPATKRPQSTKTKSGSRDGIGSTGASTSMYSLGDNCSITMTRVSTVTTFLYGFLFATLVAVIFNIIYKSPSSSRSDQDDSKSNNYDYYYPIVEPSFSSLLGSTMSNDGGGIGYALLRTLPTFSYSKRRRARMMTRMGNDMCVICQSQLKDGQMVRWLPDCDHLFHLGCIDRWLSSNSTCPCCRAHLDSPFTVNDVHDDNFHY